MIKVVMFSKFPENVQEYFKKELSGWAELIIPTDRSEDNLCKVVKDADVLFGWKSSRKILTAATKAKLFINPGAGVERHTQLFKEFPTITLVNTHGNSSAVAQHAVAMLLSLANQIIPHHQWMKEGNWLFGDDTVKSTLLQNKTVGLLGFGAIAKQFTRFVSGFDLNMIVYKRRQIDELPKYIDQVFYGDEFNHFLNMTDILLITIPLNQYTENLIDQKELELLGKDALLINVARGPIVNEQALYHALKDRIIQGAAIDVWYDYRPEPDNQGRKWPYHYPFHELPNLIISPHRADSPLDDIHRWNDVITNIKKVHTGDQNYLNIVDLSQGY